VGDRGIIVEYVRSCTAGSLGMSDCGPVWQLSVIAGLLVIAVAALVILRVRAVAVSRPSQEADDGLPPAGRLRIPQPR
jgi:hypothetical protein